MSRNWWRIEYTEPFLEPSPFIHLHYRLVKRVVACSICVYVGTELDFHPLGRQSKTASQERVNKINARCPRCRAKAELNLGRSIWNLLCASAYTLTARDSR